MQHKISVLVQIDLHSAYIRLVVTGCLTVDSQQALCPLIRRARTLIPPVAVTVDLTGATHLEAAAVDRLRGDLNQEKALDGTGPVHLVVPDTLPPHPALRPAFPFGCPGQQGRLGPSLPGTP